MERPWSIAMLVAMTVALPGALVSGPSAGKHRELFVAAIFSRDGRPELRQAAAMAIEDVNNRKDILQGYRLNIVWNISRCEPGSGAGTLHDFLRNPPPKMMVLCEGDEACAMSAEDAKTRNIVALSIGPSSPTLLNRKRFSTLFRVHPSVASLNPTATKLLTKFGWRRISILHQEAFSSAVEDLKFRSNEAGVEICMQQGFLDDPTDAMHNLRSQDAGIIVGLFYTSGARRVMCEAYKNSLYGEHYLWLLLGPYEDFWYGVPDSDITCTLDEMKIAAEGHVVIQALMLGNPNQETVSGMVSTDLRARLGVFDTDKPKDHHEASLMYDAVWAAALALEKTAFHLKNAGTSLDEFDFENEEFTGEIYSAMHRTQFLGVSGIMAFSETGDRIALNVVEQLIDGRYVKLGTYDALADNLTWHNLETWKDGTPPRDRNSDGTTLPMLEMLSDFYRSFYLVAKLFRAFI